MTGINPANGMDPLVTSAFVLTVILEIAIPLILTYLISRKFGISWNIFFIGLGFFIAVQIIHVPLVVLTQGLLALILKEWVTDPTILLAIIAVYLGLMAGIFEEVGRYLVFTWYFSQNGIENSRENALMFGAGWGGVESIIVGLMVSLGLVSYVLAFMMPELLTAGSDPAALKGLEALYAITPVDVLYGLAERMMTIVLQIAWTLMVMYAVIRKAPIFLGVAILWHAVMDFLAVFISGTAGIPASEGVLFLFALAGLGFIFWVWPRMMRRDVQFP